MSGLCGWMGQIPTRERPDALIHAMADPLRQFDASPVTIGQGARHGLAVAAPAGRAFTADAHGYAAAIWGRPEFTAADLNHTARTAGPAIALIEALIRFGPECCTKLTGTFAVALVSNTGSEALLAIDRMGVHNLVFTQVDGSLVFASTADAIHRYPGTSTKIDWQSIYNYVHFHMVPGPATVFQDQQRLLPGQYLHLRDGKLRLDHYWRMQFIEDEHRPFGELREKFLSTLTSAVRRMSTDTTTGAFLSGGTDSSTVSGLLGEVSRKPANTFSIGFAEQGYDEMDYARVASRHFKTALHEYYVTPADIVEVLPKIAAIYDQPFGNSSAVPTYCCARLARENGMALLLGGDGGDELFGGNDRYATQYRYSRYENLPRAMRRGILEPLARALPGGDIFPPVRWYRRLIELASMPMPERMDAHNLLTRLSPSSVFTPELLSKVDLAGPQLLMRKVYEGTDARSLINKMLHFDFQFTLADSDLPKVTKSCELAGLPVDFPMLDDPVVAFSARLPPALKLKGTQLRYFFKEALRGFLPEEIITKTKHGFGLPFGYWLRTHKPLHDLIMDSLGSLRHSGVIRSDFLDRLMNTYLHEHPGYYGTMAWVLTMLAQWSQRSHAIQRMQL